MNKYEETGEEIEAKVKLGDFCKESDLQILLGNSDDDITFKSVLVNRPGLLFAGFDDYFGSSRVQVVGNAEYYYLASLQDEAKKEAIARLYEKRIPCVIYTRGILPSQMEMDFAKKYKIPVLSSQMTTTWLMHEVGNYLDNLLAPTEMVHGSLLDINGVGVLLTGSSGLGKSETAIELINRGHRIIADDAVVVKRVRNELVGKAPEKIKDFIEVRGLGIIDVRSMYGVGAVLESEYINLVIHLDKISSLEEYDRLGSMDNSCEILGVSLPQINVPVLAGRNVAVIVEVATRNYRLKRLGYNALDELKKRTNLD
ncbi:MAG: HPr(Ser) kinase/phosphatase [Clostridiales bacterium]|nr:HPr(Ser) kinase/phosphatase [Clostridiales bacterium]